MPKIKFYTLTETAAQDFRDAKAWSLNRWGPDLTKRYFTDLHEAANHIAKNLDAHQKRDDLAGDTGLCIHPIREHYLIYVPDGNDHVIIVALIRQGRNVPDILRANAFKIHRELDQL